MVKAKNLKGMKFGKWTVIRKAPQRKHYKYWLCRCECGHEQECFHYNLLRALPDSGCRDCMAQKYKEENIKYPKSWRKWVLKYPEEWRSYRSMLHRCYGKDDKFNKYWRGKGVIVCKEWRNSFPKFVQDMGPKPSYEKLKGKSKHPKWTIDRFPDKDGNYEPGNCRWATKGQQCGNSNNVVLLKYNGERLSIAEWGRRLGHNRLGARLSEGWSVKRAMEEPVNEAISKGSKRGWKTRHLRV